MTNFEYYRYCFISGWRNVYWAFIWWSCWMTSDYSVYDILDDCKHPYTTEEKEEMTKNEFWWSLENDVYDKEFMDYLYQMIDDIDNGKVELIPVTQEMWDLTEELVGGIDVDPTKG